MALDEYAANAEIIGRDEINDLEAILSVSNTDVDEAIHTVEDNADAIFTWDYEKGERPALNKLYEKAKHAQWNGETDLPWETEVDLEKNAELQRMQFAEIETDVTGTPLEKFTEKDFIKLVDRDPTTGRSASSCTASRAHSSARPRSSRPCRGSTPSTTRRPRSWTRPATSRCSPSTCRTSRTASTRSTPT